MSSKVNNRQTAQPKFIRSSSSSESPASINLEDATIQIITPETSSSKAIQKKHLHRDLFSVELSLTDKKYFTESFQEIIDESANFDLKTFIEFSFYHILFFMVLGPFTSLLLYLIYGDLKLARNLGFWGCHSSLITQMFIFIVNFFGLFGYLYFRIESIYLIEILMLLGGCSCRSFVIAIKYALFSEKKLNYVKYKLLSSEESESEFLFFWYSQEDSVIDKELYSTILRNNIDEDVFLFYFLRPLKPELIENIRIKTAFDEKFREKPGIDPEKLFGSSDFYTGFSIARFLIRQNRSSKSSLKKILFISMFLSLIHAVIPLIYRNFDQLTVFGETHEDRFIIVCLFLGNFYFYFFNFMFILFGVFEYERPIKLLSHLTNLLSTKKVEKYHIKKIFPTINLFCSMTFKSWFSLNKILRDYGSKFLKRIDMYLVVFLLYYLIIGLVCILSIFEAIQKFNILTYVMIATEMIVVFSAVFWVIFKGVVINEHFIIHLALLNEIKEIIADFVNMDILYFEKEDYKPKNEIYALGQQMNDHIISHNFSVHDKRNNREKRENYYNKLLAINQFVAGQLKFQKDYYPFKVLGIPATMATLQSLLAGVGTGVTVAFNKLYTG